MQDFNNIQTVYYLLILIVPGLIIVYVRSQLITGRMEKQSDSFLTYFSLSAIYLALVLPISSHILEKPPSKIAWILLIFVGPAVFGFLLGLIAKFSVFHRVFRSLGVNPVHTVPTAWDWKFGNLKEQLVLITLKDETKFFGYCGAGSFISSDPSDRDIFIEKIYTTGEGNEWLDAGDHGVWIAGAELRSIEFFPVTEKGYDDGERTDTTEKSDRSKES